MHIAKKLVALVAIAGSAIAAAPAAAAEIDTSKNYRITTSTSLALDIQGASRGDGAPLIQCACCRDRTANWKSGSRVNVRARTTSSPITTPTVRKSRRYLSGRDDGG